MAYGVTEQQARRRVLSLALRVIADRIDHDEPVPAEILGQLGIVEEE